MRSLFLILFVLFPLSAAAVSQESPLNIRFEIRANGLRFGELSVDMSQAPTGYSVAVTANAQGLAGLLLRAHYHGNSLGVTDESGTMTATGFSASSKRIFKHRNAQVTFTDGRPVSVVMDPFKDRTELSDPKLVNIPVLDPLSFLALMVFHKTDGCPVARDLYDGRRQTRVSFSESKSESGDTLCTGFYEIVKGPDHSIIDGVRRFGIVLTFTHEAASARLVNIHVAAGGYYLLLNVIAPQK